MDKIGGAIISVNTSLVLSSKYPWWCHSSYQQIFYHWNVLHLEQQGFHMLLLVRFHTLKIECYAKSSC